MISPDSVEKKYEPTDLGIPGIKWTPLAVIRHPILAAHLLVDQAQRIDDLEDQVHNLRTGLEKVRDALKDNQQTVLCHRETIKHQAMQLSSAGDDLKALTSKFYQENADRAAAVNVAKSALKELWKTPTDANRAFVTQHALHLKLKVGDL